MKTAKLLLVMLFSIVVAACGGGGSGAIGGSGTTTDATPPTVSPVSPANDATGVAVNSAITAIFSEPMLASTITTTTFTLSGGVTGVVTNSGTTATFTPSSSLAYNTTYTATITTGVKDAAGNAMVSPHAWTFTTGAAPSGALDTTFGSGGIVTTSLGDSTANAVAIQTDGKIVVVGTSLQYLDFALARYNTDGSLDAAFGTGGKVTTFIIGASTDIARAIAIQTDGRIVAAGSADGNFALVRYNTDGSLDATFDTDGKVTTSIVGIASANAVAVQTDGKIVAAGSADGNYAIVRYNPDGSLDTTFDSDGKVTTNMVNSNTANAVAIQADGKIVAAGNANGGTSTGLVRYNMDGSLDTTFDADGKVTTSVPYTTTAANAVLIQPDGKIVVAGNVDNNFALFRYNADGSLETIFERTSGANDFLMAVAIQTDGKFVAAGYTPKYLNVNADFALRRYNTNGSFDTTFGTGGRVATPFGGAPSGGGYFVGGHAVAIQTDGKIVAAGTALNGTSNEFAVTRYLP